MTTESWIGIGAFLSVLWVGTVALLIGSVVKLAAARVDAMIWKEEAKTSPTAAHRLKALEEQIKTYRVDAEVTRQMHPGYTVLLDRLADRDEALADLRRSHGQLTAKFQTEASQLADLIAEARVADLHERLLQYSRELAAATVANAELRKRCGDDSDLDDGTDLV